MQATNKGNHNSSRWLRRPVVVLFALLLMIGAIIGIAAALHISMATSSAFFAMPSVDPVVAASDHLPFGLEADPAEHELYRQLDEQCREEIQSQTYAPLADCR